MNSARHAARLLACPLLMAALLCLIAFYTGIQFGMSIVFLLVHEGAHLFAAHAAGYRLGKGTWRLLPFGMGFGMNRKFASPMHDMMVSMAGPLANFLLFLLFHLLSRIVPGNQLVHSAREANLVLCFFNMLPAGFLDGGRVLGAIMAYTVSYYYSQLAVNLSGIGLGACMIAASVMKGVALASSASTSTSASMDAYRVAVLPVFSSISFFLAGLFILVDSALLLNKNTYTALNHILCKGYQLDPNKRLAIRFAGYSKNAKLLDIIKNFCFNKYYVIYIIEDGKLRYNINEADLICLFCKYGNIKLEDCVCYTKEQEGNDG